MQINGSHVPAHAADPSRWRAVVNAIIMMATAAALATATVVSTVTFLGSSAHVAHAAPARITAAHARAVLYRVAQPARITHSASLAHPFAGGPMIVRAGDTLSLIAKNTYPKGTACWPGIYRANRITHHPLMGADPNVIRVGQRLDLPRGCDRRPLVTAHVTVVTTAATGEDGLTAPARIPQHSSGGGTSTVTTPGSAEQIAQRLMPSFGFSVPAQFGCLYSLWMRESGWNKYAENPGSGAYGIPQSLPGSKMASAGSDWRTSAVTQIKWGLGYIAAVYGTPCGAWSHEESAGWY